MRKETFKLLINKIVQFHNAAILLFLTACCLLSSAYSFATEPPYLKDTSAIWVDSVLKSMTLDEKIGQLFMVAAYSNKDEASYKTIDKYINEYKVGGLIFFQGTPQKQAELTNRYQAQSKTPLWIGFDGEWGLGMRLDNTISYPRQLTLGAIDNTGLIYDMGKEIARQMKRIGIHINFAPDIDVNSNPNNPVINDRAFGDNKFGVVRRGLAYMQGMQDNKILASGKHFPGHGDTDVDSHKDLPVLNHSLERLESVELYPFKQFIRYGVGSIMVSHLNVLALDGAPNFPATLSPKIIQQKLIDSMHYNGLIFTDAMNMKGITKFYPSGVAEVMAIMAGNDVMLFPDDVDKAIDGVRCAVLQDSIISEETINRKVRKILAAKYWLGLNKLEPIKLDGIDADINSDEAKFLKFKLVENAITVAKDSALIIPVLNLQKRIANVSIGSSKPTTFSTTLDKYTQVDHFFIPKDESLTTFNATLAKLKDYHLVIIDIQDMSRFAAKNYGLTTNSISFLKQVNKQNQTILTVLGSPYSLKYFQDFNSVIVAYNEEDEAESIAAQIIFGARGADGTMPVTVGKFEYGDGVCTNSNMRLKYGHPLEVNMNAKTLQKADAIIYKAIEDRIFPGAQLLVAKDGNVIYEKAYGFHTYDNTLATKTTDLFDIASVTKVTATVPMIMKMQEQGKMDINKKLGDYYTYPEGSNKKDIVIKEMLCHQSGLPAWIPFYKNSLDAAGNPDSLWYSKKQDSVFSVKISDSLYLKKSFQDSVWNMIYNCGLSPVKDYKYSDLAYYLLQQIIEKTYKDSLQNITRKYLYAPLGMNYTQYNPKWNGYDLNKIMPTEKEKNFRQSLLLGTVHDQGAALLGGVAGHAGVFSNANDLAKYFQLLLNGGTYGGYKYYEASTIKNFTSKQFPNNRRAIGFDKPTPIGQDGPTCDAASAESFGHTGFTGTIAWADPKNNLVFIFLCNRVYPSADVNYLAKQGIRPKIQQVIYDAINK
ncbi:MAG TPA: glycoside hydrolase family 3 N-terminal domain-containing protein [Chitinophagales bacterium]|nr:glycoside hydrolase family 3 N-terminal domain-containing protein [Chitinophagales bacterium]